MIKRIIFWSIMTIIAFYIIFISASAITFQLLYQLNNIDSNALYENFTNFIQHFTLN